MRIAMFSETFLPATDGIVTRLCATLKHLQEDGHEVLLFAPEGAPAEYAGAKIVEVPAFRFFLYPDKNFAWPWPRIGRELKVFQPDLIHAVNPAFLGIGAIYYAWKHELPLVASYHTNVAVYARHYHLNWLEPALWWYFRSLHNRAHINLCTSKATLAELEANRFCNLGLWERGVDVDTYASAERSDEMRQRLAPGCTHTDKILLFVGRLAPEKRIERLRPCLDQVPGMRLAIVGDGPHRTELEQVFDGTRTHFTGFMHGADLAAAYASADGFVFPSTTETLGLVLFEAMAAALPIIAADSPPTREVLENGRAGFIFDAEDEASIVDVTRTLFEDLTHRDLVKKRGREIAMSLDWRTPTNQLLGHYQRVFAPRQRVEVHPLRQSR